jgi:hypothetical protein
MFVKSAIPIGVVVGDIQLTGLQCCIINGCFFQLQHQVLTFSQETRKLRTVFFLMQFFNVIDFHALHQC